MSNVYFIKPVGMDGPIKIGCSSKPQERLTVLASWSPFPLEIVGTVKASFAEEGILHKRFGHLHSHREWFLPSPELRLVIEKILNGMPIVDACRLATEKPAIRHRKRAELTPDRQLFIDYGRAIRKAVNRLAHTSEGRWRETREIRKIMRDWRCDRTVGHLPITPSPEQLVLLDNFIRDPKAYGVFLNWHSPESDRELAA